MVFELLQLIGGFILASGWVPQILKIVKTKSVTDLSAKSFWLVFIGIAFMEIYAVNLVVQGVGIAFLITNTLSLLLIGLILTFIYLFKNKNPERE
ncbi:PQ-loop domain-containing transporter [Paenibacillus wynnii]|uniref:PQ-loop domain-containing transporter n=1 Tax=Paenibacillus wynnii TaxID=268407 RepID=UPI002792869B|nr:PQ-loop domain-containing transporter [Paenibacillus wynnii]MDQ0194198.1 MtN3 and saliva related transmembrane protein [Paenibacillus wynnii]